MTEPPIQNEDTEKPLAAETPTASSPEPAPAPPPDGPPPMPMATAGVLVTREELAQAIGKNERTIRRWERTRLAPALSIGSDGVHRFDVQRVSELLEISEKRGPSDPDAYDGLMAQRAFALFDDGHHPVDVVKQTGFDPRAVKAMYMEWTSMRGGLFVPAEVVAKIASLPWLDGPNLAMNGDAQKLLACIMRTRPRERCSACDDHPPELCSYCAKEVSAREASRRAAEDRLQEELRRQESDYAQSMRALEKNLRAKRAR
jgi:hypothetical protein